VRKHKGRRFALRALISGSLIASAIFLARALGYRINESPSLPLGLWKLSRLNRPPRAGDIISFCPPDTPVFREAGRRGYLGQGACDGGYEPLLKPAAAVEGDEVTAAADGIRVNGRLIANSKARVTDRAGRKLPQTAAPGGTVPEGMVWVISSYNTLSFDSRYFGPVPAAKIEGVARPILVFEGRKP
jgi:conjugative transfer signal peptidase TraF